MNLKHSIPSQSKINNTCEELLLIELQMYNLRKKGFNIIFASLLLLLYIFCIHWIHEFINKINFFNVCLRKYIFFNKHKKWCWILLWIFNIEIEIQNLCICATDFYCKVYKKLFKELKIETPGEFSEFTWSKIFKTFPLFYRSFFWIVFEEQVTLLHIWFKQQFYKSLVQLLEKQPQLLTISWILKSCLMTKHQISPTIRAWVTKNWCCNEILWSKLSTKKVVIHSLIIQNRAWKGYKNSYMNKKNNNQESGRKIIVGFFL